MPEKAVPASGSERASLDDLLRKIEQQQVQIDLLKNGLAALSERVTEQAAIAGAGIRAASPVQL